VADQELRQLDGRHFGDPMRHLVEHLEGVQHALGGVLGRCPPEGQLPFDLDLTLGSSQDDQHATRGNQAKDAGASNQLTT
jgi:hypothetical protein